MGLLWKRLKGSSGERRLNSRSEIDVQRWEGREGKERCLIDPEFGAWGDNGKFKSLRSILAGKLDLIFSFRLPRLHQD